MTSAGETAIEAGIATATDDKDFSVGGTFLKNMVVNSTVGIIPGATEAKIGVKVVAIYGAKLAVRTTADATLDTVTRGGDFTDNLVKSGVGNVGGDILSEVVKRGGKKLVNNFKERKRRKNNQNDEKGPNKVVVGQFDDAIELAAQGRNSKGNLFPHQR